MRSIGEGIWIVEREFRMFGAEFGNRMTIIRLSNQEFLVHSPIALDSTVKRLVEKLGRIAYIVTPNAFHGLFVDEWMAAFPEARHITAKGEKRGHAYSSEILSCSVLKEWLPVLEVVHVDGLPKVNEFAFFHKVSRTLILTDLAFNISKNAPLWTRVFFSLNDAYGKFGPSRLMRSMVEDQAALKSSLLKILEWDFEQIVVSHGDVVMSDGKEIMRCAFQQYLTNTSSRRRISSLRSLARCG